MATQPLKLWTTRTPVTGTVERQAERAQAGGWDGITFTDSQNLVGDPFVAVALASRVADTLEFGTGVANLHTRHPAALAAIAITAQEESGGRFTLGVGRGDTALFHLGLKPMKVAPFTERLEQLQHYLSGRTPSGSDVEVDGEPSKIRWLARTKQAKVPLDVAASGPKVIALAARVADVITFAVGADADRMAWAIDLARTAASEAGRDPAELQFGAYVNVGCHPDVAVARDLISGGVSVFAHFSAMPGSTGAGLDERDKDLVAEVGRRYNSNEHLSNAAAHNEVMTPSFVDRFAIVGPPEVCAGRLRDLADLGLSRFVITGPGIEADKQQAKVAGRLLGAEVLPAVRAAVAHSSTES